VKKTKAIIYDQIYATRIKIHNKAADEKRKPNRNDKGLEPDIHLGSQGCFVHRSCMLIHRQHNMVGYLFFP
jgi:hypothetical protein